MCKKVAILTWLNNENYGSILQAYALQKFIQMNGYDVLDIDYNASAVTKLINWVKCKNSYKLFKEKFDMKFARMKCKSKEKFADRTMLFEKFKQENIKRTKTYRKPEELVELKNQFDIFICGSDQIWSPKLLNPVFYFDFLPNDSYKIAYAPSFGVNEIEDNKKQKIKQYLESFSAISVREDAGQKIIYDLLQKEYPIQVDPTLLLSKNEWNKITTRISNEKKYILCYFLKPNDDYIKIIRDFSKRKKIEVVIITTSVGPFNTGFVEKIDVGPKEWLGYINEAEYVFTDSFHGMIFSLIYEKQFTIFKRFSDNDKASQNSRIYSLAKTLEIESRIADQKTKIDFDAKINYENVRKITKREQEKSQKWLLNALREAENGKH